jgi:hypothetical protein
VLGPRRDVEKLGNLGVEERREQTIKLFEVQARTTTTAATESIVVEVLALDEFPRCLAAEKPKARHLSTWVAVRDSANHVGRFAAPFEHEQSIVGNPLTATGASK